MTDVPVVTADNIIFLVLLIPTLLKEIAMVIGAYIVMKKQKHVEPSHWYGKAASVILFLCSLVRILVRGSGTLDVVLCCVMVAVMLAALALYYFNDFRGKIFGKKQNP